MSWPYNSGLVRINDLGGTGTRMVVADAIGNLSTQTINTGDITSVVAGNGLTGGGLTQDVTLNIGGGSGITVDVDDISVNVSDFMSNGANTRVLTAAGLDDMHANSWLTYNGSRLFIMPAGGSGDGQLLVRGLLNNNPSNTDALMRVDGNGTTMTVGVNNDSTVWLQTWPLSSTGTQVASKMSLFNLGIHSLSIIAVFKFSVFIRSFIMAIIIYYFKDQIGFLIFNLSVAMLIIFNSIIYLVSFRVNKKDFLNSGDNVVSEKKYTH